MGNSRLSQLPAPAAIEETDFEGIFARKKAALTALCPESIRETVAQTLELESEPLTIDLQQQAYQELLVRNRINEAVKANLLAYAQGSDLDHITAQYGLSRKTIRAADPDANPPVAAEYETDDAFRARVQAHPEKYAAGPRTAYEAHAIDAHPQITHARAVRRAAGTVEVYIKTQSGTPDETILTAAREYLSAETRRPLCDNVQVTAAQPKDAAVEYSAEYHPAANIQAERQTACEALDNLWRQNAHIGASVALSKIIGALDTPGVKKNHTAQPRRRHRMRQRRIHPNHVHARARINEQHRPREQQPPATRTGKADRTRNCRRLPPTRPRPMRPRIFTLSRLRKKHRHGRGLGLCRNRRSPPQPHRRLCRNPRPKRHAVRHPRPLPHLAAGRNPNYRTRRRVQVGRLGLVRRQPHIRQARG
ncbi:baseplate J/gp47 family protein [Neisseria gonorrhoeae]